MNALESLVDMSNFKIIKTAQYLPENIVDNHHYASYLDTNDEWIVKRTGIKERRINKQSITDMLAHLLSESKIKDQDLSQIRAVIVASSSNLQIMPNLSSFAHGQLGLNEEVLCIDINTACSGFVSSLITASKFIQSSDDQVLVIGIDQMSSIVDQNDRNTCILFGDGAGLMLLQGDQKQHLLASYNTCEYNLDVLTTVEQNITMQGQDVFKYAVKEVTKHISELLKRKQIHVEDLDYVVCHQANERILQAIRRQFNLTEEQVLSTIKWTANTSSASIPICFDCFKEQFQTGEKIIMVGFGAGLITSSILYEI